MVKQPEVTEVSNPRFNVIQTFFLLFFRDWSTFEPHRINHYVAQREGIVAHYTILYELTVVMNEPETLIDSINHTLIEMARNDIEIMNSTLNKEYQTGVVVQFEEGT